MAKSKITEVQQGQICAMVGVGCSLRSAARLVGCHESTVRSLLYRDKAFAERYRKSEQAIELIALRNVQTAAQKNWRAAAWLLEHVRPNEYGPIKTDVVTAAQMQYFTQHAKDIISGEIRNPEDRRRVAKALGDVAAYMLDSARNSRRDRIDGVHRKPEKMRSPA